MDVRYISLDALAGQLGLPRRFLRDQARCGVIPCLPIGGRMRFDESAVREALRRQAEQGPDAEGGTEAEHAQ